MNRSVTVIVREKAVSSPVFRFPFHGERAHVAQLVERVLGKDEVTGSIPVPGSSYFSRDAGVTQRQSLGFPSRWLRVRIPSPAPDFGGLRRREFQGVPRGRKRSSSGETSSRSSSYGAL